MGTINRIVPKTNRKTIILNNSSPEENLIYNIIITAFYDIDNCYDLATQYVDKINYSDVSVETKSDYCTAIRELEFDLISAYDFFLDLDKDTITRQAFNRKYKKHLAFKFAICTKCKYAFLYQYEYLKQNVRVIPYKKFSNNGSLIAEYKHVFYIRNSDKLIECPKCNCSILCDAYGIANNFYLNKTENETI